MSKSKVEGLSELEQHDLKVKKLEDEKAKLLADHKNIPRNTETHRYMRSEIAARIDVIDAELDELSLDRELLVAAVQYKENTQIKELETSLQVLINKVNDLEEKVSEEEFKIKLAYSIKAPDAAVDHEINRDQFRKEQRQIENQIGEVREKLGTLSPEYATAFKTNPQTRSMADESTAKAAKGKSPLQDEKPDEGKKTSKNFQTKAIETFKSIKNALKEFKEMLPHKTKEKEKLDKAENNSPKLR
ncbi:MAG: hypothetical protein EPN84_08655 [Legionella sp.]|nr:MAG: hypothetical protein EPN84_08655 [Legionella sp.]